ncbi:LysR family transcriptional regulator [Vibrio vulnificus]|nr:LysR family transcriptional regulator [Vibrio vulnificus]EHH1186568.1 LysR family transcriptional regulator [Vibrio vulnificus]EHK9182173.1 LysR family transcriptional regulator [Vibrio vulnificus]EHZ2752107.1 LysR family transcriptional regulator [Vibrio vulnificus]EHZ2761417.1 LysR family transcriptional regulator [Vibrio vulnificus]
MLNNINLNLLRSLLVLLEECHVSRAADRLHITQSAMSRQLAQLRELCADPLLVREGNRLVATPHAEALRPKLVQLLSEFEHLFDHQAFNPQDWQGQLVLSSSDYVAQFIVPALSSILIEQAPRLTLSYRLWQPQYLDSLLDTGIHLASTMLPSPPKELSYTKIGEDYSVCVMRQGHPLSGKVALSLEEMLSYSHIKVTGGGDKDSATDSVLRKLGKTRHIALQVPFFSAAVNVLIQSDYLMVVPEHIAVNLAKSQPICHCPLPFETEIHQYWLMWHPKYDHDSAHRWAREKVTRVMLSCEYSIGMISNHGNHD